MTETLDRVIPATIETEWVTDAELIRRSGVPEKIMRRLLRAFDENKLSGFPKKNKLWGDRRHWPSVKDFWKEEQKRKMAPHPLRRAS